MNVKMLKTMSGPAGVQRAGTDHDFDDDEAFRLIEAGIAEPTNPDDLKNLPAPPAEAPPAEETTDQEQPAEEASEPVDEGEPEATDEAPDDGATEATSEGQPEEPAAQEPAAEAPAAEQPTLTLVKDPEPTAEELVAGNTRAELEKIAKKAKIKDAAKLKDKAAVAAAIVAARG